MVSTSNDIPRLVLESDSFDALMERVRFAVPELIMLNSSDKQSYSLTFLSEWREEVIL